MGNKTTLQDLIMLIIMIIILWFITYAANAQSMGYLEPQPFQVEMESGDTVQIIIENPYADSTGFTTIWKVWYLYDQNPSWIGEITQSTDTSATLTTHAFPCEYWGPDQYCWYTLEVYVIDLNSAYVFPAEFQNGTIVFKTVSSAGILVQKEEP